MFLSNKYIICIWAILLVLSCTNTHAESSPTLLPELAEAENCMYAYPDSALHILEKMTPPKIADKYQYATWCLLLSQAKIKNYIELESDSLISIGYKYFQQQIHKGKPLRDIWKVYTIMMRNTTLKPL